jgi:hypothetical protein
MDGLVLANVYAPELPHHGATMVVSDLDPDGLCAYCDTLVRFAGDWLKAAEKRVAERTATR